MKEQKFFKMQISEHFQFKFIRSLTEGHFVFYNGILIFDRIHKKSNKADRFFFIHFSFHIAIRQFIGVVKNIWERNMQWTQSTTEVTMKNHRKRQNI